MTAPVAVKPEVPVALKPSEWRLISSELRHLGSTMDLPLYRKLADDIERQISGEPK